MTAQLTLITALFALLGASLIAAWRRAKQQRRRRLTTQLNAIRINHHLKNLMSQVQQHRGLASLYLNGDNRPVHRIQEKKGQIAQELRLLAGLYNEDLMTPTRWQRINDYWARLDDQAMQMGAEESFERHSDLIRQILFLIGDVAEHGQLTEIEPEHRVWLATLWSQLPATAEAIGQARAVGAGVAAAGHCSSVARIKLRYLQQQVQEALARLQGSSEEAKGQAAGLSQKVGVFLGELEQNLLLPAAPCITADHYFRIATEALEAVYEVFDLSSGRLERKLAEAA
jgi:hypothetical protein